MKQFNHVNVKAILFDKLGMQKLYENSMMMQKIICSKGICVKWTGRILPMYFVM